MRLERNIPAILVTFLLAVTNAQAVCPVCTILAVSGVGLSHYIGIDDAITGIWIGGLLLSASLTFHAFLKKRNIKIPLQKILLIFIFYSLTIVALYQSHFIGLPENTVLGYDKLIFGIVIGSFAFSLGIFIDLVLRALNDCKGYFIFQKVLIPIFILLLSSLLFYCFAC